MIFSEVGKNVEQCWLDIPRHFPHASLDAFVVMPDHVHGIIVLNASHSVVETPHWGVSTKYTTKSPSKKWASGSLGVIINQFKMTCTKRIRNAGSPEFQWQPRYHDRIIRSSRGLNAIRKYICANPEHWTKETIP
jgi:REP element-mobilizing transposase RayT